MTIETTTPRDYPGIQATTSRDFAADGGTFYTAQLDTERGPQRRFVAADADGTKHDVTLVPWENRRHLEKKFAKLVRKAGRLGFDAPVLTHVGDLVHTRQVENEWGVVEKFVLHYGAYTLVAAPVHFNGWSFVATINHTQVDDGQYINLINKAPAFADADLGVEFRQSRPLCQHCNTARRRNDTFIIRHEDSSRLRQQLQVGRNCIQDYLGDADGTSILSYAQFVAELRGFCEDDLFGLGSGKQVEAYSVDSILAWAAASVEFRGFVSRGSVRENGYGLATADHVIQTLVDRNLGKLKDCAKAWGQEEWTNPVTDSHRELAESIIEWTRTIADDTDSDYLWNLKVACGLHTISSKQVGIVASAVTAYDRHINGQRRKAEQEKVAATSEYIGKKGDKIGRKLSAADKRKGAAAFPALTVTVSFTRSFETDWGTTTVVNFTDTDGNVLIWFASNGASDTDGEQVAEGKTYTLVGTIKGHKDYKGIKQTSVNRCKLTPVQVDGDDDDTREEAPVDEPAAQAERDAKEVVETAQRAAEEIVSAWTYSASPGDLAEITIEQIKLHRKLKEQAFEGGTKVQREYKRALQRLVRLTVGKLGPVAHPDLY